MKNQLLQYSNRPVDTLCIAGSGPRNKGKHRPLLSDLWLVDVRELPNFLERSLYAVLMESGSGLDQAQSMELA